LYVAAMPALPDAPFTTKVQLMGTYGTTDWANVFYVRYATPDPSAVACAALATSIATSWGLYIKSLCNVSVTLTNVVVTDINDTSGNQGSQPGAVVGTKVGAFLPANVAICATKVIPRRYRGGHPRMYLVGQVQEDTLDQRNWKGSTVSAVQAGLNSFLSAINTAAPAGMGATEMVSVSYWYTPVSGQPPVLRTAPIIDKVTAFRVDSRIDSQRRRLD
jgi:hypothetical protein